MSLKPTLIALSLAVSTTAGMAYAAPSSTSSECDAVCLKTELPANFQSKTTKVVGGNLTPAQMAVQNVAKNPTYRTFVPSTYNGNSPFPMIVVLHPSGGDQNSAFAAQQLTQLAEKMGYIIVSPLGYNSTAGYGNTYPIVQSGYNGANNGIKLPQPQDNYLSEVAVMSTIAKVKREMNIDPYRVYLMGYGMGSIGAQHLATKYPGEFAAISAASGAVAASNYPYDILAQNHIAAMYVQGDEDRYTPANATRNMYLRAKQAGVDTDLVSVENANSQDAWVKALPQTFNFFTQHRKY
ncbi:alpha/beta hydrolase-fold protein [Pokkaliibacter sp. CJK22405]|uniref:alpha/beta hydrolase-fold protein n=1 Tax=Pokkaliibacter sp. CJK22405 TaxID=3384615 RepID=UPI003984FCBE